MAQALVSLFAILDPLGNILVFYLFARHFSTRQKVEAAAIAVAASFVMLAVFAVFGDEVLDFLGISQGSFRVAAGLLLVPAAYRLVAEGQPASSDEAVPKTPIDFALVPLATPLIAGPGALAATASFSASVGLAETLAAVSIVLVITFVALVLAEPLFDLLGAPLLRLIARVVGILLFAIAVDFVMDGIRDFIRTESLAILLLI
jgi:multiple antibiotic resistance protein